MVKRIFLSILFLTISLCATKAYCENVTYLIDTPTPYIMEYGSYNIQFRMFSDGGVLTKLNFGVFKSLNLGVSWELSNLIGVNDVTVAIPALQVKFNVYSGNETIPAMAIGYDGQGYFYDTDDADFIQKGKGVYFVFGREILLPSLNLNAGINVNDFKKACLLGFIAASYTLIEETLLFMAEYDNIGKGRDARVNAGFKLWITENLDLDFILRNCTTGDKERFGCERIFRIGYQSKF